MIHKGSEDPVEFVFFFNFTTAIQDKIKQRERSVLEKWGTDVSRRRIFTKLRESMQ